MQTVRPALIARLYRAIEENRMSDAVILLSQVFSFYGRSREHRDSFFLTELIRLADEYVQQGHSSFAEEHYKLVLALYEAFFTEHHAEAIAASRRLCDLLSIANRNTELTKVLDWAYVIVQRYESNVKGGSHRALHAINWHTVFSDSQHESIAVNDSGSAPELRVLLVEDNEDDAELLRDQLSGTQRVCSIEQVDHLKSAITKALGGQVDVILLDLGLPDSQAIDTFYRLNTSVPHIPIIVLTGMDDRSMAIKAIRHGAHDYLIKGRDQPKTILQAIEDAMDKRRNSRNRITNAAAGRAVQKSLANAPIAFVFIDCAGVIQSVNNAWAELTGMQTDSLIGKRITEALPSLHDREVQELLIDTRLIATAIKSGNTVIDICAWAVSSPDNGVYGALISGRPQS